VAIDLGKLVQDALGIADSVVPGVLRQMTYVNISDNPVFDPDTGQILNGTSYTVKAVVSGYSAFEIANNVAQLRDIKLTIAAREFPAGFKPTTNDRAIVDGETCLVADWQTGTVQGSVFFIKAHRP
jgi:hypothetical protein